MSSPRAWLWGVIGSATAIVVLTVIGVATQSFGFAFLFATPFVAGMVCGRWVRAQRVVQTLVGLTILGSLIAGAATANIAGVICGVVFAVIACVPLVIGLFVGGLLAGKIRVTGSIGSVALIAILLPLEQAALPPPRVESVSTTRSVDLPSDDVFSRITFYEDTRQEPPRILRIALPRPLRTLGEADSVGDRPRCIYDSGYIVKEITRVEPPDLYAFRVIEQRGVEDHAVSLVAGSFKLDAQGQFRTRVTLTTTYRPKLSARVAWRPFEQAVIHALHDHVLDAMFTSKLHHVA